MAAIGQCAICGKSAEHVGDEYIPAWKCSRCGNAEYHKTVGWVSIETTQHRLQLAAWVREQNAAGIEFPNITPEISRSLARRRIPGLRERADRVLGVIAKKYPGLNKVFKREVEIREAELQSVSYSSDEQETTELFAILLEDGYFREVGGGHALSVKGLLAAEALGASMSNSAQGFVAMWFDDSLKEAWTSGFNPAIRAAGYDPLRLDNKDYVGGISDQIIAEIRRSRFVVADYTGQVNGVYFEAGFALGLGLTVIPTCRADQFDNLHFDIRHLNTLKWSEPKDLVDSSSRRILAVSGAGPNFQEP